MSTIIEGVIMIGFVVAICLLVVGIHNRNKRKAMNSLLEHFGQLGAEHKLSFSSREILTNCVFGFDGVNRKVLVVARGTDGYDSFIIDLNEVRYCSVKWHYGTLKSGNVNYRHLEQHLQKIVLHFELHKKPSFEITFYNMVDNSTFEIKELEKKARHWEEILTKMKLSNDDHDQVHSPLNEKS